MACHGHEARRHKRTQRQRDDQDAGDELATPLKCVTRAHVYQDIIVRGASLFQISAAVRAQIG